MTEKIKMFDKALKPLAVTWAVTKTTVCHGEIESMTEDELKQIGTFTRQMKEAAIGYADIVIKAKRRFGQFSDEADKLERTINGNM